LSDKNDLRLPADQASIDINKLPIELRRKIESLVTRVPSGERTLLLASVEQRMFSGPVPPPDFLAAYEQVEPGMASRLVALAEKNSDHIRARQTSAQRFEATRTFLGQAFAFILCMAAIVCGTMLLLNDKNLAGFVSLVSALAIFAGSFYHKKSAQHSKPDLPPKPEESRSRSASAKRRKR
jgi:uncharacterized membrane protein